MQSSAPQEPRPLKYFFLIFVLAIPFWLLGGSKLPLPINLPASALATFVPTLAAAILCYRRSGLTGVKEFLQQAWDYKKTKHRIWYLPALLLAPATYALSYLTMRLTRLPLPPKANIPLRMVPAFSAGFLIGDTGEELGWSGYAIDPLQKRWGAAKASLLLGVVWAIWHSIPFVQTRNSTRWVVWQSFRTVATRVVIVWIYNKTGKSTFAATLYHATDNLSWSLFPNYGSHYNPFVTGAITWLVAGIVLFRWRARTSNETH